MDRDTVWSKWVSDNINIKSSKHIIKNSGEDVLKFWMVDPGNSASKIVVETGGLKPGYLGPPESYNHIKKTEKADL